MNKILFVDDDDNILSAIRRMLRPMRNQWQLTFASSGNEALIAMEVDVFDAIVSDTRMPGMNGIELLNRVKELYPRMIRIGLSGQTEEELALLSTVSTHQQLTKPCEPDKLIHTITSAIQQCETISNESLKQLITSTTSLPSLPNLYHEINDIMNSSEGSLKDIAVLVAQDIAVSAKVLQLVNSAFFGIPRHVSSAEDAVLLLGYEVIKNLVVMIKIIDEIDTSQIPEFDVDELWHRSNLLTSIAKHLSKELSLDKVTHDHAQISCMFLELGTLIMLSQITEKYTEVIQQQTDKKLTTESIEKKIFACTHADVGAALLGIWGIPEEISNAVKYHLTPSRSDTTELSSLTVAHIASVIYWQQQTSIKPPEFDTVYISQLKLDEKLPLLMDDITHRFF